MEKELFRQTFTSNGRFRIKPQRLKAINWAGCPTCGAVRGEPCVGHTGFRKSVHRRRVQVAKANCERVK